MAVEHDCQSVALPAISAGVYGYPLAEAARIAVESAFSFQSSRQKPERIVFVLFGMPTLEAFEAALRQVATERQLRLES